MRLIDVDRLCNDLAKRWSIADKKKEDLIRAVMADVVTPIVVSQPTVDAVEVARCRDCKYNSNPPECGNAVCVLFYGMTDQMGFCHHGERREQDDS